MDVLLEGTFYNPTKGNLKPYAVLDEMVAYMREKPSRFYEVIVGCDSSAVQEPTFPVAIVVLRKGEGGRFFLQRVHYQKRKFHSRQERILQEVSLSCTLALWLREKFADRVLKEEELYNYQLQYIHADIGENGLTRDMIKEVTGFIRGNGFVPMIKPESFAASTVADRFA